jgi:predicted MFS family arabinose efflux permease
VQYIFSLYKQAYSGINKATWVLAIVQLINRIGSMLIIFLSLYLTNQLGYSLTRASIVMSCYGVGGILGNYIGGELADKFHYRKIMITTMIGCGLIMLAILPISQIKGWLGFAGTCIILLLYAMVADAYRPSSSVAIGQYAADGKRTQSIALVRMTINLAFGLAPIIGGLIIKNFGYAYLFYIDAATSIMAGLFLWKGLAYKPKPIPNKKLKSSSAYKDKQFLLFILLVFFYGTLFFQLLNTMPQYFNKQLHFTEDTIGWLLGLNGLLVMLIEMPLVASLQENKQHLKIIIVGITALFIAYLFLIIPLLPVMVACILFILFISLSEMFAMPFMMNYTFAKAPEERQGQYSALYSIAYASSFIASPMLGLQLADGFGFNTTIVILTILSLGLVVAFIKFKSNKV